MTFIAGSPSSDSQAPESPTNNKPAIVAKDIAEKPEQEAKASIETKFSTTTDTEQNNDDNQNSTTKKPEEPLVLEAKLVSIDSIKTIKAGDTMWGLTNQWMLKNKWATHKSEHPELEKYGFRDVMDALRVLSNQAAKENKIEGYRDINGDFRIKSGEEFIFISLDDVIEYLRSTEPKPAPRPAPKPDSKSKKTHAKPESSNEKKSEQKTTKSAPVPELNNPTPIQEIYQATRSEWYELIKELEEEEDEKIRAKKEAEEIANLDQGWEDLLDEYNIPIDVDTSELNNNDKIA